MWKTLPCSLTELNLNVLLSCGQSFRWHEKKEGEWMSVLCNRVWTLKQDPDTGNILYHVHNPDRTVVKKRKKAKPVSSCSQDAQPLTDKESEMILHDYFQLSVCLESLYSQWSQADENFKEVSAKFLGIRILRQDPIENLFSFICSSNNNITRITSMVKKLCENWGRVVGEVDGETFYTFPTVEALSGSDVEAKLRNLGFGYRARYINQSAQILFKQKEHDWLTSLRTVKYEEAHKELTQFPGVGAKVADCVCLMSLDKEVAIPVDTHVWQIATRDYLPHLQKNKTLTTKAYKEIGDFFRAKFGTYAGWAHSVLFCSDLKKFVSVQS